MNVYPCFDEIFIPSLGERYSGCAPGSRMATMSLCYSCLDRESVISTPILFEVVESKDYAAGLKMRQHLISEHSASIERQFLWSPRGKAASPFTEWQDLTVVAGLIICVFSCVYLTGVNFWVWKLASPSPKQRLNRQTRLPTSWRLNCFNVVQCFELFIDTAAKILVFPASTSMTLASTQTNNGQMLTEFSWSASTPRFYATRSVGCGQGVQSSCGSASVLRSPAMGSFDAARQIARELCLHSYNLVVRRGHYGKASGGTTEAMSPFIMQRQQHSGISKHRAQRRGSRQSDDPNSKHRSSHGPKKVECIRRYGCPFSKHNPERYEEVYGRACTHPPGLEAKRVVEHLRRVHSCLPETRCRFCGHGWTSALDEKRRLNELHDHLKQCTAPQSTICGLPEYMNAHQEDMVSNFEREPSNGSPDSLWVFLYMRLFPGAIIPSPSYDYFLPRHKMAFATPQRTNPVGGSPFGIFELARGRQTIEQDEFQNQRANSPLLEAGSEDMMDGVNIFELAEGSGQTANGPAILILEDQSETIRRETSPVPPRTILPAYPRRSPAVCMQDFGDDETAVTPRSATTLPAASSVDTQTETEMDLFSANTLFMPSEEGQSLLQDAIAQDLALDEESLRVLEAFSTAPSCDAQSTSQDIGVLEIPTWLPEQSGLFPDWQVLNTTDNLTTSGFWGPHMFNPSVAPENQCTSPEPEG